MRIWSWSRSLLGLLISEGTAVLLATLVLIASIVFRLLDYAQLPALVLGLAGIAYAAVGAVSYAVRRTILVITSTVVPAVSTALGYLLLNLPLAGNRISVCIGAGVIGGITGWFSRKILRRKEVSDGKDAGNTAEEPA